jgi:hypothetical protein
VVLEVQEAVVLVLVELELQELQTQAVAVVVLIEHLLLLVELVAKELLY